MAESSLSSQIKRTGNILRKGASDQIVEYNRRFESIKDLYDSFLVDLFVSDFSYEKAYETARRFFGYNKVEFAAVDGTEYTRPLFDMVIFFGGSYAARGFIEFRNDKPPKVEYTTRFVEQGQGILEKTLEFAPGEWLLSSYIATGMENVPIFIKADNSENELENFLLKVVRA